MKWYQMNREAVLKEFSVTNQGLTHKEAENIRKEKGENVLAEGKRKSVLQVFAEQFMDVLVLILIISAAISMASGNVESTVVIFAVIILNAILGTVQHEKARESLESLKSLSTPSAKVIREGNKTEILSKDVVPGDLLVIEAGDLVAADGRILENYSLQVNESSLTGESVNVDKTSEKIAEEVPLADRTNMVYSGSLVTYGRAVVIVTETGMQTEIGKIAGLMNDTKEKRTPLQMSLDEFSKKLAMVILVICVIVFGLSLYRKMPVLDSLMFAVALAVAAIPEALGSIVTIVQAMGTQKMARENAIIKDLKAVESLGCVSVICSDKTGTLTQNKMTVQKVYTGGSILLPEQMDADNPLHKLFLYNSVLNNDSSISGEKKIGDPTEIALVEMGRAAGEKEEVLRSQMERISEIPFDSDRKCMSSTYEVDGQIVMFTKGAIDSIMDALTEIQTEEGICEISQEEKEQLYRVNETFSANGLRVLTFAYKVLEESRPITVEDECDLIFLGFAAMIDPPRKESLQAVADAKMAGMKPIMITGDHKVTASAIAAQIGIFSEGDLALTGTELDAQTDEQLDEILERVSVYARVSPENKIRIVDAWQKKGCIVAMTGDGVNDAPALKKADIGVAMGITGTDVSKDAASMILTDDNFATIIKAVGNGRNVYRNIKNAIQFLLSGNAAGILAVLYASIMALPAPFEPVHLLFINLLTDSLPAIAIGMEPGNRELLKEQPRNPKTGILTKDFLGAVSVQGLMIAAVTITAFYMGLPHGAAVASTMAFATLSLARLFHGFNCRSRQSVFQIGFLSNPYSIAAFFAGVCLLGIVLFIPALGSLFLVEALTMQQIGWIVLLAFLPTGLIQAWKLFKGR